MEKQQKQSIFRSSGSTDVFKRSQSIITKCDQTTASNAQTSCHGLRSKTGSKLPTYVFDPRQPNPQEKQVVNKCVERIKSTLKRSEKPATIRKSELGENQLAFTSEETMKLEIIDEFLEKGFSLPDDPFAMRLRPQFDVQQHDIEKCIRINNHPHPFQDELDNFQQWSQFGNRQTVVENLDQPTRDYLQSIDLTTFEKRKKKKNQIKLLNFTKKFNEPGVDKAGDKERASIETVSQSQLHKLTRAPIKIQQLRQSLLSNYMENGQGHECFGLKKRINPSKLNPNIFRKMDMKKERLNQLTAHFSRVARSAYMTPQRIQAIYECKMIKTVKKLMSNRDYINLRITTGPLASLDEKRTEPIFYETHHFTKRSQKDKQGLRNKLEIDKILDKNRNRIKLERQRVIQKLRC